MHELKFVAEILKNLEQFKLENNFINIKRVNLLIGELSGIDERALCGAFEMATQNSAWAETEIHCTVEALMVNCRECNQQSKIIDFDFICTYCKSRNVIEVAGRGIFICSVEGIENPNRAAPET
jgi:hydrogenase nickel incorporation protein HypA/HybF